MSFLLANFLGNANNSNDSSGGIEDKQLIIEKLTAKMVNSGHLEDRKAAAQTIKSLARSHRLEIGTLALQALIDELKRDLEDEELAKIVLETLDILCRSNGNNLSDSSVDIKNSSNSDGIEVQFCEILLKNEQNVTLLLDIMGDSDDFYLRFTSIQILMSLCNSQPYQLKSAVLNSPSGVSKVLDLLRDTREIVRNEGLLFCGALVRGNADLQKILAFQGAFEQVMQIIVEEEGPWTGQLIIQDAFNLISGMLNLNTANQIYFRDSVCFKQLAGVMALPDSTNETDVLWNRTRISNYLAALSVLDGLLCKSNVDLEASQNSALKTHFLRPLLALAFTPKVPVEVSASALNCLSGLIWSNNRTQQEFAKEKLTQSPLGTGFKVDLPISPLMGAVILAVHSHNQSQEGLIQRFKSLDLVEAFCSNNPEGQLVLLSTLKSTTGSSASPGSVILEALFDLDSSRKRDPWHCWFASALLCHLINGNENAKLMLLKHQNVDEETEGESEDVLTSLMISLIRSARDSRGSTCQKSIIGYLQLILIWFHEFPQAINRFLQEGSFVQYLIERITHQSFTQDTQIQGLSALIMGICVLFNDENVKNFGSEGLKGIIKNRIGPDLFISKLSHLKSEKDECVSELTNEILLKNYENLINLVARPTPTGTRASHTATLAQLTKDLSECRSLLSDTRAHLNQNGRLVETLKIGITERDAYILQLQKLISEKNQKIAQMAHEMSNLERQTSNQQSDQDALNSLNETIRSFQETVARQQARIEELEALLNGYNNSELEKWKQAYHKLYEQVQQQLNVDVNANLSSEITKETVTENFALNNINSDGFEDVTVTSAFCPTERITVTSAFCPDSEPEPQQAENNVVEVLSPSMFMSPLAESEPAVLEADTDINNEIIHSGETPELVTLNQLPGSDSVISEYPELKEPINTSFNAAVIVSEEFAKNQPNPEHDEPFISSECPPDNFLASDDSVEIVSKEEIRNVLDFFDKLPQESDVISVGNSSEVKSIMEGIDHLHVTENANSIEDENVAMKNDNSFVLEDEHVVPEEIIQDTNINSYKHDEAVQEESQYFSHTQENATDYTNDGNTTDYALEGTQDYTSYENPQDNYNNSANEHQQEVSQDFTEHEQVQEDYTTHEKVHEAYQDFTTHEQVQEAYQDFTTHDHESTQDFTTQEEVVQDVDSNNQVKSHDYTTFEGAQEEQVEETKHEEFQHDFGGLKDFGEQYNFDGGQVQDSSIDYFSQEPTANYEQYSHDQEHTSQSYDQSYEKCPEQESTEFNNQSYDQADLNNNYPETSAYEQPEQVQVEDHMQTTSEYTNDYTGDYNTDYAQSQDYSTENVQDYSNENVQDYSNENVQDYNTENIQDYNTENIQDYNTANIQDYNTENVQDHITENYSAENVQHYSTDYPQEQGTDQVQDYSNDYNVEYTSEYTNDYYTGTTDATQCATDTTVTDYTSYDHSSQQEYNGQQSYDNVTAIEQPHEQQSYEKESYDNVGYETSYFDGTQVSYDQTQVTQADVNQAYDNSQSYDNSQYAAQVYDDNQAYDQVYDQAQSYDQVQTQAYDNNSQVYDQSQAYDNTQTETQTYDQSQEQNSAASEYYYYDEATGYTYGFDQNVNQYYYYDPNTGKYTYYTAEADTTNDNSYNEAYQSEQSVASSNPSLFDTAGPPMIPLQQHQPSSLSTNNFVIDQQHQQQVYNL